MRPRDDESPEFVRGARQSVGLCFALVAIGAAWGYVGQAVGLTWWMVGLIAGLVYAGPSMFLAATMIALGAGVPAIVATTFVANLRYTLFTAALVPLVRDAPVRPLVLLAHGIADGSFAVTVADEIRHPGRSRRDLFLWGSFLVSWIAFVPASVVAALLGDRLPHDVSYGLNFSSPAIYIAILATVLRTRVDWVVLLVGGTLTVLGNELLPRGTGPLVAMILAASLGAVMQWRREERSP